MLGNPTKVMIYEDIPHSNVHIDGHQDAKPECSLTYRIKVKQISLKIKLKKTGTHTLERNIVFISLLVLNACKIFVLSTWLYTRHINK